jgi:hypothetical protein
MAFAHFTRRKHNEAVFRAIADPTRREILGMLHGRPHSVGEIAARFHTSRPAISKHLRMLRFTIQGEYRTIEPPHALAFIRLQILSNWPKRAQARSRHGRRDRRPPIAWALAVLTGLALNWLVR